MAEFPLVITIDLDEVSTRVRLERIAEILGEYAAEIENSGEDHDRQAEVELLQQWLLETLGEL